MLAHSHTSSQAEHMIFSLPASNTASYMLTHSFASSQAETGACDVHHLNTAPSICYLINKLASKMLTCTCGSLQLKSGARDVCHTDLAPSTQHLPLIISLTPVLLHRLNRERVMFVMQTRRPAFAYDSQRSEFVSDELSSSIPPGSGLSFMQVSTECITEFISPPSGGHQNFHQNFDQLCLMCSPPAYLQAAACPSFR